MTRPPAIPSLLMRALLPGEAGETIAGDLDEQWSASGRMSRLTYTTLALRSITAYWRGRLRRSPGAVPFYLKPQGDPAMRSFLQDLHYGLRLLRRSPAFTAAALITLAIGIGANTAVFSLINVLMLRPLPYRDPARVAFVHRVDLEQNTSGFGLPLADFVDLRARGLFADAAAYAYWSANLTGGDQPERVQAYRMTANTFELLGVPPLHGRTFTAADGSAGAPDVVVLSFALWERRFAADASIVGRDVQVDGKPHTVVGVMPRSFEFPVFNFKGEVYSPLRINEAELSAHRRLAPTMPVVVRLRAGEPYSEAQTRLTAFMRTLEKEHPETNRASGAKLVEMGKMDDEIVRPGVAIVLATVGAVLLLACANVANLLLARGVSRRRELAVRAALGAGRSRIVRQLVAECLLLAAGGAVLGIGVASLVLDAIRSSLPEIVITTQPNLDAMGLDRLTLVVSASTAVVTALLAGLAPALHASRLRPQQGLTEGAASGGSAATRRLRSAVVVAEVAVCTALLIAAGLLVRSYQELTRLSPGFNPDGVLTLTVTLPDYKYSEAAAIHRFFAQALAEISRIPGVTSAAAANVLPFSTYNRSSPVVLDGIAVSGSGREPSAGYRVVSPDYFRTLEIPVLAGRAFDGSDSADGARVAIVNEAFTRRYLSGTDPIGRRLRLGRLDEDGTPWLTIVGVVGDVHHDQLTVAPRPELYVPHAQAPVPMMMIAARTVAEPASIVPQVRSALRRLDAAQPIYHVKPMQALVGESLFPQTSTATVVSLFGLIALVLAAVGIYGVISYAVSQQTREFGVRLALGARPADLMRFVMSGGFRLVALGIAVGTGAALALNRLLAQALYGIGPADPATYSAVVFTLALVGLVACGMSALRAMRLDPVHALRVE